MKKTILAALALALIGSPAYAVLVGSGTGVLPSLTGGGAGTTLTANWQVTFAASVYTYSYILNNPSTDTTNPEQYSVSFNASLGGNVLSVSGGTSNGVNPGSSVFWNFTPITPGSSTSTLSFTSPFNFTLGPAGANDMNPPAPWSSLAPGGVNVAVPATPDSGSTVALLGIALTAIEGARRMFRSRKA